MTRLTETVSVVINGEDVGRCYVRYNPVDDTWQWFERDFAMNEVYTNARSRSEAICDAAYYIAHESTMRDQDECERKLEELGK